MERTKTCRDCGGRMAEGHIIDTADSAYRLLRWWKGAAQKSWIMGFKVREKDGRAITSYRCKRCGLLQNYVHQA